MGDFFFMDDFASNFVAAEMRKTMTVYDLSREQLDELKSNYFWSDDFPGCLYPHWLTGEMVPVLFPGDIPDTVIFEHFAGTDFVNDDFFCTAGMEG